jgi:hypothetical protein
MNKQDSTALYELLQIASRQHYEIVMMSPAVNADLQELVEKGTREPAGFGFVCRHLLSAMNEVKKAERNYLNAKSVYQSRLQDVLAVLENGGY